MSDILEENRVKEEKRISTNVSFDLPNPDRRRIVFHIERIRGLPKQPKQPLRPTTLSISTNVDNNETFATGGMKPKSVISWGENVPIQELLNTSKVRFELKSQVLWNKAKVLLGTTETYNLHDLMQIQKRAGEDRSSFIELSVTLNPAENTLSRKGKRPSSPDKATLTLSIHETAVSNRNSQVHYTDFINFVEKCRKESLQELDNFTMKMQLMSGALKDSEFVSIIDIILGIIQGARKRIQDQASANISKTTVALFNSLNRAFVPFHTISERQLSKKGVNSLDFMKQMLCSVVKALEFIKVAEYIEYFNECERFLVGLTSKLPKLVKMKIEREPYPSHTVPVEGFPVDNFMSMSLPEVRKYGSHGRSDLVQVISEWLYTPSVKHKKSPTDKKQTNVLCLHGVAGSGKTQLAARTAEWFRELDNLGGYFSFTSEYASSSSRLLDGLPMTLIHQISTVDKGVASTFGTNFSQLPYSGLAPLEDQFQEFFSDPIRVYVEKRAQETSETIQPLVFILDGVGSADTYEEEKGNPGHRKALERRTVQRLADFLSSDSVRHLPSFIKFLVLSRSEVGLHDKLRDLQVGFVYEISPITQHVEPFPFGLGSLVYDANAYPTFAFPGMGIPGPSSSSGPAMQHQGKQPPPM